VIEAMRKIVLFILALSVPALLSVEVWQVYRYRKLETEVGALEAEQKRWLEENKKVLANISLFRSPERIEKLSEQALGLESVDPERILTIKVPGGKGF